MSQEQYTYEDWYDGKVILSFARRNSEPNALIVDWEYFSEVDKIKIEETQKAIFEQSVINNEEKVKNGFLEDYKRTRSKIDLVNRRLKRFTEVFNGNMICDYEHCCTSDDGLTFEFWYYQEMKTYIDRFFIGGQLYDFSNVHSPNSLYWNQDVIMPEVMVEVIGSMISLLKSEKQNLQSLKIKSENNTSVNDIPLDSSKVISEINPYPDIFSTPEAYKFFCELEKLIVLPKTYVAGYAFIFHNLSDKKLNFPIKKNVRQVDFCNFLKEHRGQKEIYPAKLPNRPSAKNKHVFGECQKKYLTSIQLKEK